LAHARRVPRLGARPSAARGGPWARGTGLYTVSVTIFWHDGHGERRFVLDSARLGTVAASGP